MSFTFRSALRWWVREMPDAIAVEVDGEPLSFAGLWDWSGRVSRALAEEGVTPGDFVMPIGVNTLDYAVLIVALARMGAVGVPLTFRSAPAEVQSGIANFRPGLVVSDADRHPLVDAALAATGVPARHHDFAWVRSLRNGPAGNADREVGRDDPVFIIHTSGSTGKAKAAITTNFNLMTYACEFAVMEPRCARGAVILSLGPFSSASGYLLLLQFLATGATLLIESRFEPQRALDLLQTRDVTAMLGVPLFFERIAALPGFAAARFPHFHFGQVAGSRVGPALLAAWREKGVILRQGYGSTEAGGGWAARDDTATSEPEKAGRAGPFGEFAVKRPDGSFADPGEPGELVFRGASLTPGYWNDPAATAEALRDGWLHSGDIGTVDAAGNITFIDRLKDIIISGGLNISAAEVEQVIARCAGVEEVAVIAAQDAAFGETPLALVHGDAARIDVAAIIAECDRCLASYKVPRYLVVSEAPLPRLPSGKVSKPALREQWAGAADRLPRVR